MAKTLPATFTTFGEEDLVRVGDPVTFDAEGDWRLVARDQHWLLANRIKRHVHLFWANTVTDRIRETTAGAYSDRLEFRITPRHYTVSLRVWIHAERDAGAGASIRISIGATNTDFAIGAAAWQTGTIAVTGGLPPATDLVIVRLQAPAGPGTYVQLNRLTIDDEPMTLAQLP